MTEEKLPLVIDNGSYTIKAGFAEDDCARQVFPTIVGTAKNSETILFGNDARKNFLTHHLEHVVAQGFVQNWDMMEKMWQYTFSKLQVVGHEQAVLMTEMVLNASKNREQMAQIMFEKFAVPAFHVANQAELALYASGRASGIVLDSGDTVTHAVPIVEGKAIPSAVTKLACGGSNVTFHLVQLLTERGYSLRTIAEHDLVREMKERLCFVTLGFDQEMNDYLQPEKSFELPDGSIVHLGNERFRCTEALFQPNHIGMSNAAGIHAITSDAIAKCDSNSMDSKIMYSNIVLAGGNTMFDGFANRLRLELTNFVPSGTNIKVVAAAERKEFAFIGGSIIASMQSFQQLCVTKQEYEEFGAGIVNKK